MTTIASKTNNEPNKDTNNSNNSIITGNSSNPAVTRTVRAIFAPRWRTFVLVMARTLREPS